MPLLLNFFLRALLLAAGLFFAVVVAGFFVLLLAAWGLRAAWYKLTGRPVTPFVMGAGGAGRMYEEMMRRAQARQPSRTPRADAAAGAAALRRPLADVTDVEPKQGP
jgi:hypothetical protein